MDLQKDNLIQSLSYTFALKCINFYKTFSKEQNEYVLSKQFLRSSTSIWANVEEWIAAQSRKDFVSKFWIALKEARESYYWIRLLHDSNYISVKLFEELESDILSIIRVLSKILISSKSSENQNL